ncbi:protein YIPF5 homolog [Chenopodium quinoa]|uniref:protein YIPF5 homolog n=1 Tax=Chenopodium quinoa TaxID=63459 RepID=UPI000B78116B|nr:protein YIPF5 homolog [Chenopodium quinoa]
MPKEFTIPPVNFPSSGPSPATATPNPNMLHQRQVPTAPFQPQRPPSSIPFMSFDIGSATASSSSSSAFPPPHLRHDIPSSSSSGGLFSDEPPLLEELEINPSLIWRKTRSLLNPFRVNSSLHSDPDLSGPFLYYIAFGLFQLLAGKVQFGVILGWIAISSIFLYMILNFLAGRNGNLDLYRCVSVVGYCLMPIVIYSAASLFLPPTGTTAGFVVAAVFVIWATRVCSRLLSVDELGASEHRGLIAYPCFLIYCLFSMLVMF